jgi:hypothetical protein
MANNGMKKAAVITAAQVEAVALTALLNDHSGDRKAQLAARQAERAAFEAARAIRRAGLTARGTPVQAATATEARAVRDTAHHAKVACPDPARCPVCK